MKKNILLNNLMNSDRVRALLMYTREIHMGFESFAVPSLSFNI